MGPGSHLCSWDYPGAPAAVILRPMRAVRAALATSALILAVPATASAATATVTGDDGNPVGLNPAAPVTIHNMDVHADVAVGTSEAPFYTTQTIGPDGVAASSLSPCRQTKYGPSWTNYTDYRGNGTYTVVVRFFSTSACATATKEQRFQWVTSAALGITPPSGTKLTRRPNSYSSITYHVPISLNPGASLYEVRYARGGVIGPDGGISGPASDGFLDRTTGLADLRFSNPGRWVIVARAKTDDYYTPWSAPVYVNVKAPFDVNSTTFPDFRGPSYKIKAKLRENFARGKVTVYLAKGRRKHKFHKLGRAKIRSNGTFTKRFKVRKPGVYRLRYVFKGSALVAKGKVTEGIRIRRIVTFG